MRTGRTAFALIVALAFFVPAFASTLDALRVGGAESRVYLHETPAPALFDRSARAFSAGCVRVEDPVARADFLLRDAPAWSPDTIRAAMEEGGRQVVPLPARVPVHLTYFTAFVDEGLVHFREDLYGLDDRDGEPFSDLSEG